MTLSNSPSIGHNSDSRQRQNIGQSASSHSQQAFDVITSASAPDFLPWKHMYCDISPSRIFWRSSICDMNNVTGLMANMHHSSDHGMRSHGALHISVYAVITEKQSRIMLLSNFPNVIL
jgi:hypothetical protein